MIIKEIEKLIIFRLSHLQNPLCNKSKKKKKEGDIWLAFLFF